MMKTQSAHAYSVLVLATIATSMRYYLNVVDKKEAERAARREAWSDGRSVFAMPRIDPPAYVYAFALDLPSAFTMTTTWAYI